MIWFGICGSLVVALRAWAVIAALRTLCGVGLIYWWSTQPLEVDSTYTEPFHLSNFTYELGDGVLGLMVYFLAPLIVRVVIPEPLAKQLFPQSAQIRIERFCIGLLGLFLFVRGIAIATGFWELAGFEAMLKRHEAEYQIYTHRLEVYLGVFIAAVGPVFLFGAKWLHRFLSWGRPSELVSRFSEEVSSAEVARGLATAVLRLLAMVFLYQSALTLMQLAGWIIPQLFTGDFSFLDSVMQVIGSSTGVLMILAMLLFAFSGSLARPIARSMEQRPSLRAGLNPPQLELGLVLTTGAFFLMSAAGLGLLFGLSSAFLATTETEVFHLGQFPTESLLATLIFGCASFWLILWPRNVRAVVSWSFREEGPAS